MPADRLRLHHAVSKLLKDNGNPQGYTNPEMQRNIENYGVLVDGVRIANRLEWIYPGQKIELPDWPKRDHGDFSEVKILQDQPDFLLLFKPYGVVVEPGAGHQIQNLETWLNSDYKTQSGFTGQYHLVHRLDRFTQGLLLVAKSETAHQFLQDQFRGREVVKKYLAVLEGELEQRVEIRNWQTRDEQNPLRQKFFWREDEANKYNPQARMAHSVFRPLAYSSELNKTLCEVQIFTGRMHQIRLQAETLGHPLVADQVYNKTINQPSNLDSTLRHSEPSVGSHPPEHLKTNFISIKQLSANEFTDLQTRFFGSHDYGLLCNYLKIKIPDGSILEARYLD